MNAIDKKLLLEKNQKTFGKLSDSILLNINDSGLVYYMLDANNQKIYAPLSELKHPIYHEQYTGLSQTQQQFKDDADINLVLKKYGAYDDYIPQDVNIPIEYFRDLSMQPTDFTDSLNLIAESNQMFMDLPAHVRRAVGDDPRKLLELSKSADGLKFISDLMPNTSIKASNDQSQPKTDPALVKPKEGKLPSKAPARSSDEDDAT